MNETSARTWRHLAKMVRDLDEPSPNVDAMIRQQLWHDFNVSGPIAQQSLKFTSSESSTFWVIRELMPKASFVLGFTSYDHEDGEEAPEGWFASLVLPWACDKFMPEDGVTINGGKWAAFTMAECLCMAMSFAVHDLKVSEKA